LQICKFTNNRQREKDLKMASSSTPGQTAAQHMAQRHQAMQQQQQQSQQGHSQAALNDPSFLSAQQALNIEDNAPVRIVQIAALVSNPLLVRSLTF
jgi:hypothetical protein